MLPPLAPLPLSFLGSSTAAVVAAAAALATAAVVVVVVGVAVVVVEDYILLIKIIVGTPEPWPPRGASARCNFLLKMCKWLQRNDDPQI